MKPLKIFVLIILSVIIFSAGHLASEKNLSPTAQPEPVIGQAGESYLLEQGVLTVSLSGKPIWSSPKDWRVDKFVLADANSDGAKELNLSVWKSGDFGRSRPFWVKANELSVKNHFFVMKLADGKIISLWQSSNLEKPNLDFVFKDADGDGKLELITLESDYGEPKNKTLAIWRWNGWGFTNDWRGLPGDYAGWRLSAEK